jgi:hypothetical protein
MVALEQAFEKPPRSLACFGYTAVKTHHFLARGIAPVIPHKTNERDKPAFFARTLYQAQSRIEQGVGSSRRQTRRAPLRKDRQELQINRQLRRRPMLDQIRPHGPAFIGVYGWLAPGCVTL